MKNAHANTLTTSSLPSRKQQGAALVIALIFLLVLTTLAVSNMREVALDSRITGALIGEKSCFYAGEAGLRDGEYSVSGKLDLNSPGVYLPVGISKIAGEYGFTPPNAVDQCPVGLAADEPCVLDSEERPPTYSQAFDPDEENYAGVKEYGPSDGTEFDQNIAWYGIEWTSGGDEGESENPEYFNMQSGIGATYRYELNARAVDAFGCEVRLRSTTKNVTL